MFLHAGTPKARHALRFSGEPKWNRFVSPCGPARAWPARRTSCASDAASRRRKAASRDAELSRKGQAALDLVSQVADTLSQTENRIETLLVRALEQLKAMEDRNRVLEERAVAAETRAREAEKWLMRLHVEMEDKFTSWKGQQARGPGGGLNRQSRARLATRWPPVFRRQICARGRGSAVANSGRERALRADASRGKQPMGDSWPARCSCSRS